MISVRPIRFSADPAQLAAVFGPLGASPIVETDGWSVYAFDSGRVGLHIAEDVPAGTTRMSFEVPDLDQWVAQTRSAGVTAEVVDLGHGRAALVTASDGLQIQIDTTEQPDHAAAAAVTAPTDAAAAGSALRQIRVLPIWYTADIPAAVATLEAMGAKRRISSDSGTWADFICPGGGLVAVHAGEHTEVVLSFESSRDVGDLAAAYEAAGIEAMLIDETYARTLQVVDPDGPAGSTIWINEQQRDLYGFSIANT